MEANHNQKEMLIVSSFTLLLLLISPQLINATTPNSNPNLDQYAKEMCDFDGNCVSQFSSGKATSTTSMLETAIAIATGRANSVLEKAMKLKAKCEDQELLTSLNKYEAIYNQAISYLQRAITTNLNVHQIGSVNTALRAAISGISSCNEVFIGQNPFAHDDKKVTILIEKCIEIAATTTPSDEESPSHNSSARSCSTSASRNSSSNQRLELDKYVKEICDFDGCASQFIGGGKIDPNSVLEMAINVATGQAISTLDKIMKLKAKTKDEELLAALMKYETIYGHTESYLQSAITNLKAHNIASVKNVLHAAISSISTCKDMFVGKTPLINDDNKVTSILGKCLEIVALVK